MILVKTVRDTGTSYDVLVCRYDCRRCGVIEFVRYRVGRRVPDVRACRECEAPR